MNITDEDLKLLKLVRNYFGEHDKTLFEHRAYSILDSLLHKLEQLQQHGVMQAEGLEGAQGAAVGNSAVGQSGSDGVWCKWIREKRCECEADGECTLL